MSRLLPLALLCSLAGCAAGRSAAQGAPADEALKVDPTTLVVPDFPGTGDESDIASHAPEAAPTEPEVWEAYPRSASPLAEQLLRKARRFVGVRSLRRISRKVPDDCSGMVRLAYLQAHLPLAPHEGKGGDNMTTAFWRRAVRLGTFRKGDPAPGDLVFFSETYDRNRDGRRNDGLTHVGLVEEVRPNGTVVFIHRGSDGVKRSRLNLHQGDVRADENGEVLNDWLRFGKRKQRGYLAGELLTGFAPPETLVESDPLP